MNVKFFHSTAIVFSIATVVAVASKLPASAQTSNSKISTSAAALKDRSRVNTIAQVDPTYPSTQPSTPTTDPTYPSTQPSTPTTDPTYPSTQPSTPTTDPTTPTTEPTTPTEPPATNPDPIEPGSSTRGGSSYVGVGANIGIDGSTALGDTNFTVISKIGLTNAVSARPSVIIGDNTTILIPVTYDFNLQPTGIDTGSEAGSIFAPYVGGGLGISTGDDSDVGPMLTAGVDVPIGEQFTANVGANVGFLDDTEVGIQIGVGYNFAGF
ncbi:hypothetical protein [Scytonema millei]|uniref:Outer membrane protein beta-barrel domain-containing protein n=1 Tax=Scytonema millei VB511283 TaxID=1245923 RepID=A0A9X5E7Z0_9CYAN|nr:hypothetical protein [Scytonema millei]NHC36922.1 hypothetical protein [Scytonema millei VB511283]